MRVTVVGCGYVGLAAAVALGLGGRAVTAVEIDPRRRALLASGIVPIAEPALARHLPEAGITFVADVATGVADAELVIVAVPTDEDPRAPGLVAVVRDLADAAPPDAVVAVKSTVAPPAVDALLARLGDRLAVNPEFLRQGTALEDFRAPARVVVGAAPAAAHVVFAAYHGVVGPAPVVRTDPRTAALAKLAANAMLALRVGFGNELARVAAAVGADHADVVAVLGADPRIGPAHLAPSLGFGGGCLPKDARLLAATAAGAGADAPLVGAALATNAAQLRWITLAVETRLGGLAGRAVGVWGAAFKAGTDDLRGSTALALAEALAAHGAEVRVHDPVARAPEPWFVASPEVAADGADALVVATPWPVYAAIDPARLAPRGRAVFDPSGHLPRARWVAAGWSVWPFAEASRAPSAWPPGRGRR